MSEGIQKPSKLIIDLRGGCQRYSWTMCSAMAILARIHHFLVGTNLFSKRIVPGSEILSKSNKSNISITEDIGSESLSKLQLEIPL